MSDTQDSQNQSRIFYGWWMVVVAFITLAVSAGSLTYSYSVITVTLNQEFQVSQFQLMLPLTLMMLAGAVLSPFFGARIDKYPIKWFVLAGSCCLALALFLISLATKMFYVTVIYVLLMAPVQALMGTLCASVLVSRWFSRRLAFAMGLASVGASAGGFIVPPLISFLCDTYGWREAFQMLSLGSLLLLLPLVTIVVDRPEQKGLQVDGDAPPAEKSKTVSGAKFNKTSTILRSRNFWLISGCVGMLFAAYSALISNLLPIVIEQGLSAHDGALLVSLISAIAVAGKLMFGIFIDRMDLRVCLAMTVLLVVIGMVVYLLGSSFPHFVIGSVILGLAVGNMLPTWSAMIAHFFGVANYGRVMGLMGPINVLCNFVSLPMTGFLYDVTGSYVAPLMIFIVLLTISLCWLPAIKKTQDC